MIAVGIPSYNEADRIGPLVRQIDEAALSLGKPIVIINADNTSPDGTRDVFQRTQTVNQKVSLVTRGKGKGRNLRAIMQRTVESGYDYCFFIDADVTSFEPQWLALHEALASENIDYVVPNYARKMQEGNATNHFFYPLLSHHTNGKAPYQPIAGDIGMSSRLAAHLVRQEWSLTTLGYGVDIFITMHALLGGFRTVEVDLGRKIHKPSYGKMVEIFGAAATSYFEARRQLSSRRPDVNFVRLQPKPFTLLPGEPIAPEEIADRIAVARKLLRQSPYAGEYTIRSSGIDEATWAELLVLHEQLVEKEEPSVLAQSLLPWYLLRVTDYLSTNTTVTNAVAALSRQTVLIAQKLATAGV